MTAPRVSFLPNTCREKKMPDFEEIAENLINMWVGGFDAKPSYEEWIGLKLLIAAELENTWRTGAASERAVNELAQINQELGIE